MLGTIRRVLVEVPTALVPALHAFYHRSPSEIPDRSREAEVKRLYDQGIEAYEKHLKQWGLIPSNTVLEVGCGAGQWLIAFSRHCQTVCGVEPQELGIRLTLEAIEKYGCKNINVQKASAEQLPFDDQSFDTVFCYGVLMYCQAGQSLKEFVRVLKPCGKLLVAVDGIGYFFLCMRDGIAFNEPERFGYGWEAIVNTCLYRRLLRNDVPCTSYYSYRDIRRLFIENGLEIVDLALETFPYSIYATFAREPVFFRCIGRKATK